jgi:hypothetical protein
MAGVQDAVQDRYLGKVAYNSKTEVGVSLRSVACKWRVAQYYYPRYLGTESMGDGRMGSGSGMFLWAGPVASIGTDGSSGAKVEDIEDMISESKRGEL